MRTKQKARVSLFSQPHICGCYFLHHADRSRVYLPQVSLKSHSSINAQCFTTKLTQEFYHAGEEQIEQARYTFPLYDGVTVNGYTISFAGKVLKGFVKQKDEAKTIYQQAVDRGETAGLLEALPAGVFGVTLGNVPPKVSVVVDITYCGELKHDAAIDGLRYTLPTTIAPRYGTFPGSILEPNTIARAGISIVVDIDTGDAPIRRVQSPSHPIAVSMGELSPTTAERRESPYTPSQASATLSLGTVELESDFVLQVVIDRIGDPQAIIETHSALPNQRAIMATLVPKFALKTGFPEIVFVADQSGSMMGSKNEALIAALKIFLKSLPLGVRFNICAFGNDYKFLWPKSQAYNESNLNTALTFVESLKAQYGGTEILEPITAAFENRLGDLPLEVMLLTDGEIWAEEALFNYINKQIHEEKVDSRVFTLGIGSDVSHTLVEGVARAGNGFAQFVTDANEGSGSYDGVDQKIVRMLKAALFAHTKDYQLEVHYDDQNSMHDVDDEFELVEKVSDCLYLSDSETIAETSSQDTDSELKNPISFFDPSARPDEPIEPSTVSTDRYAHLPPVDTPRILQVPTFIPPLFPFNRTTVYLLLGSDSPQRPIRSVTLRAISPEGPLELNIPVKSAGTGSSVHQLAARKAIQDLEEGRGWLNAATVGPEKAPAKTKFASRFDELVERAAVQIGEKFQVAGKWTSFAAVEQGTEGKAKDRHDNKPDVLLKASEPRRQMAAASHVATVQMSMQQMQQRMPALDQPLAAKPASSVLRPFSRSRSADVSKGFGAAPQYKYAGASFGSADRRVISTQYDIGSSRLGSASSSQGIRRLVGGGISSLFGRMGGPSSMAQESSVPVLPKPSVYQPESPLAYAPMPMTEQDDGMDDEPLMTTAQERRGIVSHASQRGLRHKTLGRSLPKNVTPFSATEALAPSSDSLVKGMRELIALQTFSGGWVWNAQLFRALGLAEASVDKQRLGGEADVAATVLAIAFLRTKVPEQAGAWELVVEKARAWLRRDHGLEEKGIWALIETAKGHY